MGYCGRKCKEMVGEGEEMSSPAFKLPSLDGIVVEEECPSCHGKNVHGHLSCCQNRGTITRQDKEGVRIWRTK